MHTAARLATFNANDVSILLQYPGDFGIGMQNGTKLRRLMGKIPRAPLGAVWATIAAAVAIGTAKCWSDKFFQLLPWLPQTSCPLGDALCQRTNQLIR